MFRFSCRQIIQITRNFSQSTNSLPTFPLESKIADAIKEVPILSSAPLDLWQQRHSVFRNHGFKSDQFLEMVKLNPALLSRSSDRIIKSFEAWRSCQFGEKLFYELVIKYPHLLDVTDGRVLIKQITFLREFVSTPKNVWRLVINSPGIVTESQSSIEKRFEYLQEVMKLEVPEIVKSQVFLQNLDVLKCRHIFLERLGMFKPRSAKSSPNEISKNPKLYKIIDTTDKYFATKVCGVTLTEFEAFKDIYRNEINKEKRKSLDSDSEGSESDEENDNKLHEI